jgi:hypothetical protein
MNRHCADLLQLILPLWTLAADTGPVNPLVKDNGFYLSLDRAAVSAQATISEGILDHSKLPKCDTKNCRNWGAFAGQSHV